MAEQLLCSKHRQPLAFVCAVETCNSRKMCEECKTKENLHFTQHANFIYRIKDFYDYSSSQELIPRLEKGIQDSQNFITSHKSFYREQSRVLSADFEVLNQQFKEVTQGYRGIYLEAFDKEMNMFDQEIMEIKKQLNQYLYEKSQQQSFFSRLFSNDGKSQKQPLEDLVKKHSKVFKVRASIISLRSKISTAKANRTTYKASNQEKEKFQELKQYFRTFAVGFFDKFKELLANEGSSTVLKNDILSQSRVLSGSQVSIRNHLSNSQVSIQNNNSLRSSRALSARLPQKVKALPSPHQNVLKLIKRMKPIQYPVGLQTLPGFLKRDEGPFRYSLGTYQGTYEDGMRSGKGEFIFSKDGSYYQGTWQQDSMWGYGRLITPSSYYQGQISNGMAHGTGTFQNATLVYSGEWRCDKKHGKGEETFKQTRSFYKGQFINDKYHGQGKLEGIDYTFNGSFKDGHFEGQGAINYRNGETFVGKFRAGERLIGRHIMPDGSFYDGEYQNGVPQGMGEFRWSDGVRYIGGWKNGLQDGQGVEILQGGRELKGIWKSGNWLKWI